MTNLHTYLDLLALAAPLAVGFFVFGSGWRKEANRTFLFFTLLLSWLSFVHTEIELSQTAEGARFWKNLESLWPLATLFQARLVLLLAGHERIARRLAIRAGMVGGAVLVALVDFFSNRGPMTPGPVGWVVAVNGTANVLLLVSGAVPGLLTLLLLWLLYVYGRKQRERRVRAQAILVALGVSIPALTAVLVERILPNLFSVRLPGDFTMWSFAVAALIFALAVARAGLFEVTVEQAAQEMFDLLPDAIFLADLEGGILRMNPAAIHLLGSPAAEATRRNLRDILGIDLGSSRMLRAETANLRTDQGDLVPVSISTARVISALRLPQGQLYTVRDERDRRAMERAVAESEAKYRNLFEGVPVGLYRTTTDGRFLEGNQTLLRMLGFGSVEELRGADVASIYADPSRRTDLVSMARETGAVRGLEVQLKRSDGTLVWAEIDADLVHGTPQGAYLEGMVHDITPRRIAEQERARLEEELQRSLRREAVAQLAAGVAHDFNNILAAIQIYAGVIARAAAPKSRQGEVASKILAACSHAAALADRLLKSGEVEIRPTRVELNGVIRDNLPDLQALGGESIAIRTDLAANDLFIKADPDQLQWGLLQVAANAVEAMPHGGKLVVRTGAADRFAFVSVTDTGTGMDERTRDRIFEPYFTTKGFGTGAGHGLPRLHRIITAHGGKIAVTSNPGEGTAVTLFFPSQE